MIYRGRQPEELIVCGRSATRIFSATYYFIRCVAQIRCREDGAPSWFIQYGQHGVNLIGVLSSCFVAQ